MIIIRTTYIKFKNSFKVKFNLLIKNIINLLKLFSNWRNSFHIFDLAIFQPNWFHFQLFILFLNLFYFFKNFAILKAQIYFSKANWAKTAITNEIRCLQLWCMNSFELWTLRENLSANSLEQWGVYCN
jgi:hypothetical protein